MNCVGLGSSFTNHVLVTNPHSTSSCLTYILIHNFETIPNSKKLQTTTENLAIKGFKDTDCIKKLWKKVKLPILSNFTFYAPT